MNDHVVEEKAHAKLSPSSSKRWMTCPGSVKRIEALNLPYKPSKYAAEGTVAHEVHELCLVENKPASHYLGKRIEADGMKFKVNQNMVDAVQLSLDFIYDKIVEAELDNLTVEIQVEVKSSLEYLNIGGLDGGTSDLVLIFRNEEGEIVEIMVFDYKHGAGVVVEPEGNTQAMQYGLGICELFDVNDDVEISIVISQPRAFHPDRRIRTWNVQSGDLYEWSNDVLEPKAKATHKDDAPLVPSEDGCRFCDASGDCPALLGAVQETAMMDFDDVNDDEVLLPAIETLTPHQKQALIANAGLIRSFLVAVEEQVRTEVNSGSTEYEDKYKLVRKTTRRKFTDDATDELMSPVFDHLKHDDVFEEKPRSMTEIERRLKKEIGKKEADKVMKQITTKPTGDLVIAPLDDKRAEVVPEISSDFKDLD